MRDILFEELQDIELCILRDFDSICRKHGIKYTLVYGSMLGAVRHKGFIPWDDDIDVAMRRSDYERFLLHVDELENNHKLIDLNLNLQYTSILPKIIDTDTVLRQTKHAAEKIDLGVYVDLFVFDRVPDSSVMRKIVYLRSDVLQKCWSFADVAPENPKTVLGFVRSMINKTGSSRYIARFMNWLGKKSISGKRYCCLQQGFAGYGHRSKDEIYDYEFENLADYKFEDMSAMGVSDYDRYLTSHFGDYMTPPPEEQRVSHHEFVYYHK